MTCHGDRFDGIVLQNVLGDVGSRKQYVVSFSVWIWFSVTHSFCQPWWGCSEVAKLEHVLPSCVSFRQHGALIGWHLPTLSPRNFWFHEGHFVWSCRLDHAVLLSAHAVTFTLAITFLCSQQIKLEHSSVPFSAVMKTSDSPWAMVGWT